MVDNKNAILFSCDNVEPKNKQEFNSVKEAKAWIKEHKWTEPRDFIKYEIYKFIAEDCMESDEVIEKAMKIAYSKGRTIINAEDIRDAKNES
jgi:hypothetical protein